MADARAPRPYTLVAELTYRCALQCVYCSNPLNLSREELDAGVWCRAIREARALGVCQIHLTGGEPLLYPELERLVAEAHSSGLYVNLITSGVPLERARLAALAQAGLEHVQLSFQGASAEDGWRFARSRSFEQKRQVAGWVRELGLPLTLNFVLHRYNIDTLDGMLALAEELEADRVELANAQYLGWAFQNQASLLPSAEQLDLARQRVASARSRPGARELSFVLPDYHSDRPRGCMDGWASRYVVISPDGRVMPCHAAAAIRDLDFQSIQTGALAEIWESSPALQRFRGEDWLPEPCRTCSDRSVDHGGCRCQAFLLTGDAAATDPACGLTPAHSIVKRARETQAPEAALKFRRHGVRTLTQP